MTLVISWRECKLTTFCPAPGSLEKSFFLYFFFGFYRARVPWCVPSKIGFRSFSSIPGLFDLFIHIIIFQTVCYFMAFYLLEFKTIKGLKFFWKQRHSCILDPLKRGEFCTFFFFAPNIFQVVIKNSLELIFFFYCNWPIYWKFSLVGVDLTIRVAEQCLLDQNSETVRKKCLEKEPLAWSTIHCQKNRVYLILTVFLLKLHLFDVSRNSFEYR